MKWSIKYVLAVAAVACLCACNEENANVDMAL